MGGWVLGVIALAWLWLEYATFDQDRRPALCVAARDIALRVVSNHVEVADAHASLLCHLSHVPFRVIVGLLCRLSKLLAVKLKAVSLLEDGLDHHS